MKVAVCLSGQPRLFKTCFTNFKKYILDAYDCDLFIDAWKFPNKKEDVNSSYRYKDEGTMDELFDMYNPKVLNIENFDDTFEQKALNFENKIAQEQGGKSNDYFRQYYARIESGTNLRRYYSMLYKIYNCNKIRIKYEKFNNINYDLIIRTRLDVLYSQPINVDMTKDLVLDLYGNGNRNGGDIFAYGNSESINIYCDLFSKLEEYANSNIFINPEILLPHHLQTNISQYYVIDHKLDVARPNTWNHSNPFQSQIGS